MLHLRENFHLSMSVTDAVCQGVSSNNYSKGQLIWLVAVEFKVKYENEGNMLVLWILDVT